MNLCSVLEAAALLHCMEVVMGEQAVLKASHDMLAVGKDSTNVRHDYFRTWKLDARDPRKNNSYPAL